MATLASGASFYIAGGHALIHAYHLETPAIIAAASMPNFQLSDVTTRVDTARGTPVFVIRGKIKSARGGVIPPLNIRFQDGETGRAMSHMIPRGELLQRGQQISFTTRIPAGDLAGADPVVTLRN